MEEYLCINSTAFDYVNVLTKAADASYQREAILANNISNVDTPGYKRKDLNFEGDTVTGAWQMQASVA